MVSWISSRSKKQVSNFINCYIIFFYKLANNLNQDYKLQIIPSLMARTNSRFMDVFKELTGIDLSDV
jgi:hypothetical protein